MLILAALAIASPAEACALHVVRRSPGERLADAALVTLAVRHAVRPASVGTVLAMGDVRIVKAAMAYGAPASFILRIGGRPRLLGVWFDRRGTRRGAYDWARRRIGLSPAVAACFAVRSVAPG